MLSMNLSRPTLAVLKTNLRKACPGLRSSHADEALAFAMGYRTYASVLAALPRGEGRALRVELDEGRLTERLRTLGYSGPPEDAQFETLLAAVRRFTQGARLDEIMAKIAEMAQHSANDN